MDYKIVASFSFIKNALSFKDINWLAIDFKPVKTFEPPISLEQIKAAPSLQNIGLIKQPRLSVMALTRDEFDGILNLKSRA